MTEGGEVKGLFHPDQKAKTNKTRRTQSIMGKKVTARARAPVTCVKTFNTDTWALGLGVGEMRGRRGNGETSDGHTHVSPLDTLGVPCHHATAWRGQTGAVNRQAGRQNSSGSTDMTDGGRKGEIDVGEGGSEGRRGTTRQSFTDRQIRVA